MPVKIIKENKDVSWLHFCAQMGNALHFYWFYYFGNSNTEE